MWLVLGYTWEEGQKACLLGETTMSGHTPGVFTAHAVELEFSVHWIVEGTKH